jgi:hypothetical protein
MVSKTRKRRKGGSGDENNNVEVDNEKEGFLDGMKKWWKMRKLNKIVKEMKKELQKLSNFDRETFFRKFYEHYGEYICNQKRNVGTTGTKPIGDNNQNQSNVLLNRYPSHYNNEYLSRQYPNNPNNPNNYYSSSIYNNRTIGGCSTRKKRKYNTKKKRKNKRKISKSKGKNKK